MGTIAPIPRQSTRPIHEIARRIDSFLTSCWDGKSSFLLGFSGGPDSTALLYLLKDRVPLHVAHVDHGWREESAQEALELREQVEALGLPFHSIRLTPSSHNREEVARLDRLRWFESLSRTLGCQGLLLAHQAEDQAETILKRLLEGAHLTSLKGMEEKSQWQSLSLFRPLLGVSRKSLIAFLEEHRISYLLDPTNRDPKYLRARMREEILPDLARLFGKEILSNLLEFGVRAQEWSYYLDERMGAISPVQGPLGSYLDLTLFHPVERRHLIRRSLGVLPRGELERIVALNNCRGKGWCVDGGRLFWFARPLPRFGEPLTLSSESERSLDWSCEVSDREGEGGWEALWRGEVSVPLPDGACKLGVVPLPKSFREARRLANVPLFLRPLCPVVWDAEGTLVDPLVKYQTKNKKRFIHLKIEYYSTN